jgi:hypothetical protein
MNKIFEMIKKNIITQFVVLFLLMFVFIFLENTFQWAYDVAVCVSFVIVGYVALFAVFAVIGVIKDIFND